MQSIWVINLASSTKRFEAIIDQCREQEIAFKRWEATDGRSLGIERLLALETISRDADFLSLPQGPAVGGLCDSTVRLWRTLLLESKSDWHFIFEDDVVFPKQFNAIIESLWKTLPSDAELVVLGCDFFRKPTRDQDLIRFQASIDPPATSNSCWWPLKARVGGTFAYAIHRNGLEKLLRTVVPFRHAIDYFPYNLCGYLLATSNVPHYSQGMAFYGIVHCSEAESTIQK